MRFQLTCIFFILIGIGCSTSKNTEHKTPSDMTFTILKEGNLFGAGEEGFEGGVIAAQNAEQMNFIIAKMNSINTEIKESLMSDIHFFDESMLLFVFDQVRGSGGHTLEIIDLRATKDSLITRIKNNSPNGPASTVMTQPYVVLKTQKTILPIQLNIIE
jgi:hypothetical protein